MKMDLFISSIIWTMGPPLNCMLMNREAATSKLIETLNEHIIEERVTITRYELPDETRW